VKPGRPPISEHMHRISVRIPLELHEKLQRNAAEQGKTYSEYIREELDEIPEATDW
jgi:predicted DNA-binding protein